MQKIKVQVCQGTTCFVMGGDIIKEMLATLNNKYGDRVEVSSVRCLGACHQSDSFSKAPYICVDGEIVVSANLEKVIKIIESKLNK